MNQALRYLPSLTLTLTAAILAVGCATTSKKAEIDPHHIMEEGFAGKGSMASRIGEGTATPADKSRMVYLTAQLALNAPPRGDVASWKQKTVALHEAALAIEANRPGAVDTWKAAVNCKACHSVHQPE